VEYTASQLKDLLARKLGQVFAADAEVPAAGRPVLVADLPPRVVECRVPPINEIRDLRVIARGPSGRASQVEIDYLDAKGNPCCIAIRSEYRIREALYEKFLYSSAFKVEFERDAQGVPSTIRLRGAGWGHGAGLCQIGALGMAIKGYSCRDILRHYFEGVDLRALY
jgi:peptidoglycan hydrolase-like amidase